MKIIKFIGSILKDIFINTYQLIKGLLLTALLIGVCSIILLLILIAMSIIPRILILLNLNYLASIVTMVEIIIAFLFIIDINVFKFPSGIINYLKSKWENTN